MIELPLSEIMEDVAQEAEEHLMNEPKLPEMKNTMKSIVRKLSSSFSEL